MRMWGFSHRFARGGVAEAARLSTLRVSTMELLYGLGTRHNLYVFGQAELFEHPDAVVIDVEFVPGESVSG